MHLPPRYRLIVCTLLALVAAGVLSASALAPSSSADLQSQIDAGKNAVSALQNEINNQTSAIGETQGDLDAARDRLTTVQAALNKRVAALREVQGNLVTARQHLMKLENRLHTATGALSANLVAAYEGQSPNIMTVILQAHGFSDLLNKLSFMSKLGHQDAEIVGSTRTARTKVMSEAQHLEKLEQRDHTLTAQVLKQRNSVAALQAALLKREISQSSTRSDMRDKLGGLQANLAKLEKKAQAQARAAAEAEARANGLNTDGSSPAGLAVDTGGMVQPPANAPTAVREVIPAGNAIATLPYIWGGGHASFQASGYDCSGSVSYALAAAGLLSSPMDSTAFESYGDPGPGKWITIYANADHAWMTVAGWRFDTVALAEDGTRWAQGGGEFDGMVVRHPPGL